MAYSTKAVAAITDIPALVATFAAANGWTVDTTALTFQYGSGLTFTLSATVADTYTHKLMWTGPTLATSTALLYSPVIASADGTTATVSVPQAIHMFAGTSPKPYLAVVVQYGTNLFRHLYLGYLDTAGTYTAGDSTGGEIISAASPSLKAAYYQTTDARNYNNSYLFGFQLSTGKGGVPGGVYVPHASNPNPWRTFLVNTAANSSLPMGTFQGTEALGGFGNDVSDGLLVQAYADFASASLLVPMPIFITDANKNFRYAGTPSGVRMVNMRSLDPLQTLTVADTTWMVFPAWRRDTATSYNGTNAGYPLNETSYFVGYAYPTT